MNKEMEREAAINIVELVDEVGTGNFRQQMPEELEGMRILLAEAMALFHKLEEVLAKMKVRKELRDRDYEKLKRKYAALQEIFALEEARRLEEDKSHEDEMRQRLTMEREISSLVNKYEEASEQISSLQERIWTLEHENHCMKGSIHKLHSDVSLMEQEKNYWRHNACFARRHAAILQQQLDASYASSQCKDQEIKLLQEDMEDIRQMQEIYKDTHQQPVLVQKLTGLTDELQKCKRSMENLSLVIEDFKADKNITPQAEQLVELQQQLHSMEWKLQVAEGEALVMKQGNEEREKEMEELKDHLAHVNVELFESQLLQEKLQNIIQSCQQRNEVTRWKSSNR